MDFIKNHNTQWKSLWSKRTERMTRWGDRWTWWS